MTACVCVRTPNPLYLKLALLLFVVQGSCFSSPEKKNSKPAGQEGLTRTTSSYQGSTADATRYSDRPNPNLHDGQPTASQLAKTTTLEARVKQAEAQNRARAG